MEFDKRFEIIYDQCEVLTAYGVQPRYLYEMEISDKNMKKALIYAHQIQEFEPLLLARQQLEQESAASSGEEIVLGQEPEAISREEPELEQKSGAINGEELEPEQEPEAIIGEELESG
ncbi:MAG: hypothetical protein LBB91_10720 [Clostridiales bacterium]|jgi:hypothetical protein|nr:hypothetical protein [Clostridiales bacterium]